VRSGSGKAEASGRATVCCLSEGDYHLGVAVLANSLARAGYAGTLWVGQRGPLPPWADGRRELPVGSGGMRLALHELPPGRHISHEKAAFMLRVMRELAPEAAGVVWFDADATVRAPWPFFETWMGLGGSPGGAAVAACIDHCYPFLPALHPWRRAWRGLLDEMDLPARDLDHYVPSCFLGVPRAHLALLELWDRAMDAALAGFGEAEGVLKLDDSAHPFKNPDQDALNVALMGCEVPLALMGPEAMDFWPAGFVMSQVSVARKPWRAAWLREALAGRPPARGDKEFWRLADGPLTPFAPARVRRERRALKLASAIGRFYRRGL
jgi:hypothetical protein